MLQATCQSVGPILTQLYPCAQPGRNDSSLAPGPVIHGYKLEGMSTSP